MEQTNTPVSEGQSPGKIPGYASGDDQHHLLDEVPVRSCLCLFRECVTLTRFNNSIRIFKLPILKRLLAVLIFARLIASPDAAHRQTSTVDQGFFSICFLLFASSIGLMLPRVFSFSHLQNHLRVGCSKLFKPSESIVIAPQRSKLIVRTMT